VERWLMDHGDVKYQHQAEEQAQEMYGKAASKTKSGVRMDHIKVQLDEFIQNPK